MIWNEITPPYQLGVKSNSWFFQMTKGYENQTYIVLSNDRHIALCRKDGKVVSWSEKMLIKNELFGNETMAIEIYPPQSKLVDNENVYHLWLVEQGEYDEFVLK